MKGILTMITLRLGERHVETEYAKELAEAIVRQKKSCDIVWFSTLYGFPPIEVHENQINKMIRAAKIFRSIGIGVSLQVSNTFGHGEYIKAYDCSGLNFKDSPAEHMVGPDGTVAGWCYCWRGKFFGDYQENALTAYAQKIKPDVIWYDDDLRADNHAPIEYGCYCDNCIKEFNDIYNTTFTRETLVNEINYGDTVWRQRYIEFCQDGISAFLTRVSKAIHKVSPDTLFGIQHAHACNYMSTTDNHLYEALKSVNGSAPQSRPGGGNYHDKAPIGQFQKSLLLAYTNSLAPDYVKVHKAEIENLPDIVFGKSIGGTINESTLHLATGCTGLTYATLMSDHEPMSWHELMLKAFSQIRPYWEKLSEVSMNAVRSGITIFRGNSNYLKPLKKDDKPFSWTEIVYEMDAKLFIDGIPVVHDQRMPNAYLLHGDMIDFISDADIEFLLNKPVYTDASAVKKLCDRGYANRFSIELTGFDGTGSERFTDHSINKGTAGRLFKQSFFFPEPMDKYIINPQNNETQILGTIHKNGEKLGAATVITPTLNKNGNKQNFWIVCGYCAWNDMISSAKRNQILEAIDSIAPLPAKLISAEQAAVVASVDPESGKTVSFTIASASQGGTYDIDIVIRNPKSESIKVMSTRYLDIKPLSVKKVSNELYITLPALNPYEVMTVFTY